MSFLDSLFSCKSESDKEQCDLYDFLAIKKNGRVFWMIESTQRKPTFLATYPQLTFNAKLFSFFIKVVWLFRLQKIFFCSQKYQIHKNSAYSKLKEKYSDISFFTGTPGVNRKIIVITNDGKNKLFFKIPTSEDSILLVKNEVDILFKISKFNFNHHQIPSVTCLDGMYGFSDISTIETNDYEVKSMGANNFYKMLYDNTSHKIILSNLLSEFTVELDSIKKTACLSSKLDAVLNENIRYQVKIIQTVLKKNIEIDMYFSHGDFTLWNMYCDSNSNLSVIDWELAKNRTKYFDLIHFYVSKSILIERDDLNTLYNKLFHRIKSYYPDETDYMVRVYICLYFLCQSNYYISKYKKQAGIVHEQIYWQVNAWNSYFLFFLKSQESDDN